VKILIIEIDGFFHQVHITGRKCTLYELKQKYFATKELCYNIKDLPDLFCRMHNFDQLTYDENLEVNFVIDTDTDRIYTPSY
jgi:hypothetical protein